MLLPLRLPLAVPVPPRAPLAVHRVMIQRDAAPAVTLAACRAGIDAIDAELLRLLEARAVLALQVGEAKRHLGLPLHVPEREADVIARAASAATGVLDAPTARRLFAAIVAETRALQLRRLA